LWGTGQQGQTTETDESEDEEILNYGKLVSHLMGGLVDYITLKKKLGLDIKG
jgi:hypothetical protein